MKNRKKEITLLVIGILTLVSLVVGATYAFFKSQTGPAANFNVSTTTGTTDNLTFTTVGNILINASADNFAKGSEDLFGTITATANLIANNGTNITEPYYYNVYLEVIENELEYSSFTDPDKELKDLVFTNEYAKTLGNNRDYNGLTKGYDPIPELYLTITGPERYEYNIDLPKATLKNEDDSYDITELREGIYPLVLNKAIQVGETDSGTKKESWQVKVTLKNLDSNQQLNTGKTFNAKVIIQAEKIPMNLMDVCKEGDNLANCIKLLHDQSTYGASNLIYHDGEADYEGEENYGLEAGDKSYRYTGSYEKVNNYICFGEKCSTTPNEEGYDNLYRIVGTFGEDGIKVVKADYANQDQLGADNAYFSSYAYQSIQGNNEEKDAFTHRYKGKYIKVDRYYWQSEGSENTVADWPSSLLNTQNLNVTYYSKIESQYQSLILNHNWIYASGTATWDNIGLATNAKTAYDNEIGEKSKETQLTKEKNIGLLYVSDYLYGASQENWTKQPYNGTWTYNMNSGKSDIYNNPIGTFPAGEIDTDYRLTTNNNWLYMGLWELLITQRKDVAFHVQGTGIVDVGKVGTRVMAVRPVFYITNGSKLKSGTGTIDDPYTLIV